MQDVTPFVPRIPTATIEDMRGRLRETRWSPEIANHDWRYGVNGAYLKSLCAYWAENFDWQEQERAINAWSHFRTEIDGIPIHFIHARGKGERAMPLVLSHGWPWTFWCFKDVIGPLCDPVAHGGDAADAFDVIVPSLPGYGFSAPLTQTGIGPWRIAELWHKLMRERLGYSRFAAMGGDWGSLVTSQLGHRYAEDIIGIHLTTPIPLTMFNAERNWDLRGSEALPDDPDLRATALARQRRFASHVSVHVLDPQTIAWMGQDSPAGMAGWLLERWRAWSDCDGEVESRFSKDDLLTHFTIYWATETFGSSLRIYAEAANHRWQPSHDRMPVVEAPTGISFFVKDSGAGPSEEQMPYYNLVHTAQHESGGHFAPVEEPERVVEDIRATFRSLRARSEPA